MELAFAEVEAKKPPLRRFLDSLGVDYQPSTATVIPIDDCLEAQPDAILYRLGDTLSAFAAARRVQG